MHIDQVMTFLEIAATGNFNRAAERLNVTQSTVSARMKALESRLDHPLFARAHDGVELTAAGRHFHRYALTLAQTWQQARQEIALPQGFEASFGLGTQFSLWERFTLRWAHWMRQRAPHVALRLEADYSDSLMHQVSSGLIDIAVVYTPRSAGFVVEKLLEEKLVLVSTTERDPTPGWRPDYVLVDWGVEFAQEHANAFPEMGPPAISVGLGTMGLQFILDHGGSGYFPLHIVNPLIEKRKLFRVRKAPSFKRPVYVVHSPNPTDEGLMKLALDGLRASKALEKR